MPFDESFLRREINRFPHDFVIYAPAADDEHNDHGNEHLHVFRAKDGNLCALWTMSKFEGTFTQRPVFSKSRNGGLMQLIIRKLYLLMQTLESQFLSDVMP